MSADPERIFDTHEEAQCVRDRLNESPPDYGHGEWYLGQTTDGRWSVRRWRGRMAEDVGDANAYEESQRAAFEHVARDHDFWRDTNGIRFEAVLLEGEFPDTRLVLLFRSVPAGLFGVANPDCVFGSRWPVWPAFDADPGEEASQLSVMFMEFLGTDARAYRVRGGECDPTRTNWLN
jgi:hypothetical protein